LRKKGGEETLGETAFARMVKGAEEGEKYGSVVLGKLNLKGGIKKKGKKAKRKEAKKREIARLKALEEEEREEEEQETRANASKGNDDDLTPAQKRFMASQETRVSLSRVFYRAAIHFF
jgi:hypothetical protein